MPSKTVKVAVSLPVDEYRQVEKARKQLNISRSAVITRALKCWMAASRDQDRVRAYVDGYLRNPETSAEVALFHALASESLATEAWEE
jgi:metal-responsive CopG/Arc/MetJ family transcriptional regulator